MSEDNINEPEDSPPVNDIDISIPDILIPPLPDEEEVDEIKDEVDVSFNFAFIGAGQGGSRIAETFHTLGYRKVAALNTAEQDLNTIKLKNKLLIGDGGAGKDRGFADSIFKKRREDVIDFMRYSFGEKIDRIFICAGAGGGTGSGILKSLTEAAAELQETVNAKSKQVGVILALPKKSEGGKVAENAKETLNSGTQLI